MSDCCHRIHEFSAEVTIDVREAVSGIDEIEGMLDDHWIR